MLNRYAWASDVGSSVPSKVRFVLGDASSYLFFDSRRPDSLCRPLHDTGVEAVCSTFGYISDADATACPGYDSWKYGVGVLPSSGYAYLDKYLSDKKVAKHKCA